MTLTPREIQEKQFHDAFRGYSHEEVDLFIDQVAEAYDTIYRENQTFHRRLEELQDQVDGGPAPAQVIPAPISVQASTPVPSFSPSTSTGDSEDMLKRVLLTAQESADKALQNARQRAQALIDDAEAKARRIEDQAETLRSTTVEDAQRRANETLSSAAKEEAEYRERIEGLKIFERDFRARLTAFVRSQLELLEAKPLVTSSSPSSSAGWERARPSLPEPVSVSTAVAKPAPERTPEWLSLADKPVRSTAETPARKAAPRTEPVPIKAEAAPKAISPPPPPPAPKPVVESRDKPEVPKESESAKSKSKVENKSIRELFWGED